MIRKIFVMFFLFFMACHFSEVFASSRTSVNVAVIEKVEEINQENKSAKSNDKNNADKKTQSIKKDYNAQDAKKDEKGKKNKAPTATKMVSEDGGRVPENNEFNETKPVKIKEASKGCKPTNEIKACKAPIRNTGAEVLEKHDIPQYQIYLGANYTHVNFKPTHKPSFDGSLGGLHGKFEYRPDIGVYEAYTLAWRQGITDSGGDVKRFLVDVDTQARLGYTFPLPDKQWRFSLFSGFGFRYLSHDLTQPACDTLYFFYKEYYIPFGCVVDVEISSVFSIGFCGIWMPQVDPTVRIQPLNGARWILDKSLANVHLEVPLSFSLQRQYQCQVLRSKDLVLIAKPFFEYWKDGHSTAVSQSGIELGLPGNRYIFWGIDIDLMMGF